VQGTSFVDPRGMRDMLGRGSGRAGAAALWVAVLGTAAPVLAADLPRYAHIVVVVEENKDFDQIIGNPAAPYINRLAAEGTVFTRMFGEEHDSQGNYFWLFSGSNQNVGFDDRVPTGKFTAPNLGAALIAISLSFKGYAQSLPAIGADVDAIPWGCLYPPAFTAASTSRGSALRISRTAIRSRLRRICGLPIFRPTTPDCRPSPSSSPTWSTTCTTARRRPASRPAIYGCGRTSIAITNGQKPMTAC
jgi:hypothetical protein